jgi:hypothetical protein
MRGNRPDYRHLHNPFPDEEDDDEDTNLMIEEVYAIIAGNEFTSLKDAQNSPEWPEWQRAMQKELDLLKGMGTWETVQKPPDTVPISNKWVFICKWNNLGGIVRYKARLVAKGCAQCPGHDYVEMFSSIVRMDTVHAILALVPSKRLLVQQMDVKGAYLNGVLQETIYMKQPEGCEDGTSRVCQLVKTLYGLKQSRCEWNKQLDEKLRKHSYTRLHSDPCAYVRWDGDNFVIITVWVDELLLFASSDRMMDHMKNSLRSKWELTNLGEPRKIIGIEIAQTNDSVTISQQQYIESLLRREMMVDANPVGTPMDQNGKLGPNPEINEPNRSNSYARLLGELQYISNSTRPDITFAVKNLAVYTANLSLQHYGALKQILQYLAGTKTLGITYSSKDATKNHNLFHGFADTSFASTDDYKSVTGYVFLSAGEAITWKLKKQTIIALSTTEAEYIALSEAGCEACWLRGLYEELGFPQKAPTVIKGDNEGSVILTHNPQFHNHSKHIGLHYH